MKISRLPPDQQADAAARLTAPPSPAKKQDTADAETLLSEFQTACRRYISDIKSFDRQADRMAKMTFLQFDELSESAYAVTNAIRDFFQKVNGIRNQKGDKRHEH